MSQHGTVSILEGNTFVVSDRAGNIEAALADPEGVFAWDTRFHSRWVLTVDGKVPDVLSTDDLHYYAVQFFLVPGTGTIYVDADLCVIRKRSVGTGFHEDLEIRNESPKPVELEVHLEIASDFADLFEVKDAQKKQGELYQKVHDGRLTLGYRREAFNRETWITSSSPAKTDNKGMTFQVRIEPHSQWSTRLEVEIVVAPGGMGPAGFGPGVSQARPEGGKDLEAWLEGSPTLSCEWEPLGRIYRAV